MHGFCELKERLKVTEETVECPIKGCSIVVQRRRKGDKNSSDFVCHLHKLDISPSTFSYATEQENMLWTGKSDQSLFDDTKKVKRESRINANNSEDAVSWNVFRYLERAGLLGEAIEALSDIRLESPRIIYWSWAQELRDQDKNGDWVGLNRARAEFGETVGRGSEPDIIVIGNNGIVFIEAKVTASNNTTPSRPEVEVGYISGGDGWFGQVFTDSFLTIAQSAKKYELLRFWLLGTWLADDLGVNFHLVNLLLGDREIDIEDRFGPFIRQHDGARFSRRTWEDIWRFIALSAPDTPERVRMLDYFSDRTIGYRNSVLQRAFKPI